MLDMLDCTLKELGGNSGCQGEAEGHHHAVVLRNVEHEAEELLVKLADQ